MRRGQAQVARLSLDRWLPRPRNCECSQSGLWVAYAADRLEEPLCCAACSACVFATDRPHEERPPFGHAYGIRAVVLVEVTCHFPMPWAGDTQAGKKIGRSWPHRAHWPGGLGQLHRWRATHRVHHIWVRGRRERRLDTPASPRRPPDRVSSSAVIRPRAAHPCVAERSCSAGNRKGLQAERLERAITAGG